jgi:hypothetical protein
VDVVQDANSAANPNPKITGPGDGSRTCVISLSS